MLYLNIFKILKLILNILKEELHISCFASFQNSAVQTVTISKAMIKNIDLNSILKSSGTALLETIGSY